MFRAPSVLVVGWALASALAGCDPGYKMTGSVRAENGDPLAATLTTVCGDGKPPLPTGASDATGTVKAEGLGFFRDECEVEVRAPGFERKLVPVKSVCRSRSMGSCLSVHLDVTLRPTPKP